MIILFVSKSMFVSLINAIAISNTNHEEYYVTPCSLVVKHLSFGGVCCLHLQGRRTQQETPKYKPSISNKLVCRLISNNTVIAYSMEIWVHNLSDPVHFVFIRAVRLYCHVYSNTSIFIRSRDVGEHYNRR
jgi:hypothetical protein